MTKTCTTCGIEKDETSFDWQSAKHERRVARCKTCRKKYVKGYRRKYPKARRIIDKRHREARKERDPIGYQRDCRRMKLKQSFGLTLEQYNSMLAVQNSVCAVCGGPQTAMYKGRILPLAVDHDHQTGKIRGLLCGRCNCGLGQFQDDPIRLQKAIVYLKYHGK